MLPKMVRPDAKGRVTLGGLAAGVSRYSITKTKDNGILLEPYMAIPAKERWLHKNKKAMKDLEQGLKDSAEGRVKYLGSFSKYADEEIE